MTEAERKVLRTLVDDFLRQVGQLLRAGRLPLRASAPTPRRNPRTRRR